MCASSSVCEFDSANGSWSYMATCCFFKQKTAYDVRISDWSSDVCSSDLPGRPLERHLSFDPFGHQLELILDIALEIAVGRAAPHCAHRPHAAVALIRTPLIEERLARRLFGAREQRADHAGRGDRKSVV